MAAAPATSSVEEKPSTLSRRSELDLSSITYSWTDLTVSTLEKVKSNGKRRFKFKAWCKGEDKYRRNLLTKVHGIAKPGEILAILGASGAGKTTLLNTLTFRIAKRLTVTGVRCANSIPVTLNLLVNSMAYVQQEDLFIGALTVEEHLLFHAMVRMHKNLTKQQRFNRIGEVLFELGLTECRHTVIGEEGRINGISGGEKKRLSFASEILTNPALMFCDEPTSSLDSFTALSVIMVLKNLAKNGKTIICTIHQPSSELFGMFDKLCFMSEGRVAYFGPTSDAVAFFAAANQPCPSNYNPADHIIQVLAIMPGLEEMCKRKVSNICDQFDASRWGQQNTKDASVVRKLKNYNAYVHGQRKLNKQSKASWFAQFRAVLWRAWLTVLKEPIYIRVKLLQTFIIGLIIGLVYYKQELTANGVMNINSVLFIFLTSFTFENALSVVHVFCIELPVFLREHKSGLYRSDIYFIGKTLAELPIFLFVPVIFQCVVYYMIGLNPDPVRFGYCVLISILVSNIATGYGYFISCITNSVSMALAVCPPTIVPFLLLGGFFVQIDTIPFYLKWIAHISWFKYGDEALMINQWSGINYINCTESIGLMCPTDGNMILQLYGYKEANFDFDLICLGVILCCFRFIAFITLILKAYFTA